MNPFKAWILRAETAQGRLPSLRRIHNAAAALAAGGGKKRSRSHDPSANREGAKRNRSGKHPRRLPPNRDRSAKHPRRLPRGRGRKRKPERSDSPRKRRNPPSLSPPKDVSPEERRQWVQRKKSELRDRLKNDPNVSYRDVESAMEALNKLMGTLPQDVDALDRAMGALRV